MNVDRLLRPSQCAADLELVPRDARLVASAAAAFRAYSLRFPLRPDLTWDDLDEREQCDWIVVALATIEEFRHG